MIQARNEQYIPEQTGQQVYASELAKGEAKGQVLADLFKAGEAVYDIYADVKTKKDESEYEVMKSEYKRDRLDKRLEVEKGTPLYVDQFETDPLTGKQTKVGVSYPWQDMNDKFQIDSDKTAEGLHEGRSRGAVSKFEAWRRDFDSDQRGKLREWELDKTIDLHDYNTDQAIEKEVEDRNVDEVVRIFKDKRDTGYYDLQALDKAEEEAIDAIEKGRVYDQLDLARMTLDQRTPEDILDTQQFLLGQALQIQDDATRSKAIKDVMNLDDEMASGREVIWEENYWAVEAEVAGAESPEEKLAIYDKYLDRDDIEAAVGNEKYTKLREQREKVADSSIETDDEIQTMLSERISDYEYTGTDYAGIREEIQSRQRRGYLHPDDAAALLKRIDSSRTKNVGNINKELEKDLNGYLDMSADSTTGFARMRQQNNDPEAEMRLQFERKIALQQIRSEVRTRAAAGTLEQWVRGEESAKFVYDAAMQAKQRADGGTKAGGTSSREAVMTLPNGDTQSGSPGQIGRKMNTYKDDWELHVDQGGNESNWTGPTIEYDGETMVPSHENLMKLRSQQ